MKKVIARVSGSATSSPMDGCAWLVASTGLAGRADVDSGDARLVKTVVSDAVYVEDNAVLSSAVSFASAVVVADAVCKTR